MTDITSYEKLEALGRIRLSRSFFMRDFLHSEIANWYGLKNVPDFSDQAVQVGRCLCEQLLEPIQETFGRIHIRSGYRSPELNRFGSENKLNCASNEANYAHHIWDYQDTDGKRGATACIVVPWLVDHIERGGSWTDMAWWIHDHLPYSSLYFFPKLAAFNINWHEAPIRRIDSYAPPKGCLTRPGMTNHAGTHADQYQGFPRFRRPLVFSSRSEAIPTASPPRSPQLRSDQSQGEKPARQVLKSAPPSVTAPAASLTPTVPQGDVVVLKSQTGGRINYRAIHTKNLWRKVGTHKSLEAAVNGRDGAAGLFARKVRIDYQKHGDPLYVLVWEDGASSGYVVKPAPGTESGIRIASVPVADLRRFEDSEGASQRDLEVYFKRGV